MQLSLQITNYKTNDSKWNKTCQHFDVGKRNNTTLKGLSQALAPSSIKKPVYSCLSLTAPQLSNDKILYIQKYKYLKATYCMFHEI